MAYKNIVAIVGSYRKHGIIDQAVDATLEAAAQAGASTRKIYLTDYPIEFCRNCRTCTQPPGPQRGHCVIEDRLGDILEPMEQADGLILASPVNFGQATAITRRLLERMLGYTHWPWNSLAPTPRLKPTKPAIIISSSAMPGWMARLGTGAARSLKNMARLVGARTIGQIYIGLAARAPEQQLHAATRRRAADLGRRLAGV